MPTVQQLSTFVAVSRHGNVARAAEAMRLTASPVSRTLGQFERAVGAVFDRGYHDMVLNDHGRLLLPLAVSILQEVDDLATLARGEELAVRFAATPWVPARFAKQLATAVEQSGRAEDVDAAVSARLLHRMSHGEIDIALVHLPAKARDIDTVPIARYRFHLAVSADDPLGARDVVTDEDVTGRRLLLFPGAMHPEAMGQVRAWFEERGVASIGHVGLDDVPSLGARLRREHAITITTPDPESPIHVSDDVVTLPFAGDPPEMTLGIAWRCRDASRAERLAAVVAAVHGPGDPVVTIGE